ncbi:MAG: hypothetical protein HKN44_10155, partial [Ilumatobacter sp.]|nr:hypothetical protein [Ilumatobacter sp.]
MTATLLVGPARPGGAAPPDRPHLTPPGKTALLDGEAGLAKVDADLLRARLLDADGLSARDVVRRVPGLDVQDDLVALDLTVDVTGRVEEALAAAGMIVDDTYPQYGRIAGRAPLGALAAIAAIDEVRLVRQVIRPRTRVGSVQSQGDAAIGADVARSALGVDGTGITIGIISDSFDAGSTGTVSGTGCTRTVSGTPSQLSGDL